jgi:hypothetical protein
MIINGVEFNIDFTDADFIEKIENACKKVYEEAENLKQDKQISLAEGIRQECKILKNFLDYVLGDGTSEKLFKGKDSLNQCLKAFEDIINAKQNSMNEFESKISKYSPDRLKR